MEDPANKKFGRYEILGELGRGAMGVVYKARDPKIGRLVALKTVLLRGQEPEEEQEFRKRFLCEAQAAGRLQHPGIVAIYDVGEDQEHHDPYIVLEYVSGESLSRVLSREKKLPLARALQLAEEIAEALDYAHAQGVVHRDIKPANILLTEDGRAKIADLGIAQLNLAHFTLPGRVLGTPAYMAPEQLSGEGVDGRSDIFSLGVILYAMVTGHSPFQGNSATTVCFKVVNREPMPASAFDMQLPPALDAIIARAMAKDPVQRYQRGSECAADLRQVRLQSQKSSAPAALHAPSSKAPAKGTPPGVNPNAAAGVVQLENFLHEAGKKKVVKYCVGGAAVVALCLLAGIPIKRIISARKKPVRRMEIAQKINSKGEATAAVKPRDSIVAEMEVAEPVPSAVAPAADVPARVRESRKPTPKRAPLKARPVSNSILQPVSVPATRSVAVPTSMVELAIAHQFKDATLSLWVDDQLTVTRLLHGESQKRLVVFKGIKGIESQSFQIPVGSHQIRVRAQSSDPAVDLSKTISADFAPGDNKTLQITFEKHNTAMRLAWQLPAAN
ncbi:MAG TPA: serine/threonine-protein kinase [Candidatus Sulfotelmatobacter sp.]